MTTPERIWLDKSFQPWRVWTIEMLDLPEYVRRDPAVLAAPYSVSAEWAEKMLPADDGVTPAAGTIDGEAAYHIETALAMARVQDSYARKATCKGEKFIFKANAKAQRQIAEYIRRMSALAQPDAVEALVEADSPAVDAWIQAASTGLTGDLRQDVARGLNAALAAIREGRG